MGPAFAVWIIEDAVTVNDLVIFVLQQREIEVPGESLLELLDELLRFVMGVDADCQDLDRFLFFLGE